MLKQTRQCLHSGTWYSKNRIHSDIQLMSSTPNSPSISPNARKKSTPPSSRRSSPLMLATTTQALLPHGLINTSPNHIPIRGSSFSVQPIISTSQAAL